MACVVSQADQIFHFMFGCSAYAFSRWRWRPVIPCPVLLIQHEIDGDDKDGSSKKYLDFVSPHVDNICMMKVKIERSLKIKIKSIELKKNFRCVLLPFVNLVIKFISILKISLDYKILLFLEKEKHTKPHQQYLNTTL